MKDKSRKNQIIERFGKASAYDQAAFVQKIVAKKLAEKIKLTFPNSTFLPIKILEFGCGTGFLTEELTRLFPKSEITVSDISPAMLERAKTKFDPLRNALNFQVLDGENPPQYPFYDLICSSLSLQWFADRQKGLRRLIDQLNPDGQLWVSTLCENSFHEWRQLYHQRNLLCPIMECASISELQSDWPALGQGEWISEKIIDYPQNGFTFLRHFKKIGASLPEETIPPLSASKLRTLLKLFDQGEKKITYHVGYGSFRKSSRKGVFVTGTDTGIGKTLTAACLVRAWKSFYWKPFQTGLSEEEGDSAVVKRLAKISDDQLISPAVTLAAPLSPEAAAKQENRIITKHDISFPSLKDNEILVIEGAGGLMVPISPDKMMIDFIQDCQLPVILVARSGLGTINHTLLSLEALRSRKIPIAGAILSGTQNQENRQAIEKYGKVSILAEIPYLDQVNPEQIEIVARNMPAFDTIRPSIDC